MNTKKLESNKRLQQGIAAYQNKDYENATRLFVDAHILGQSLTVEHTLSHWWMLKTAIKTKDIKEMVGQTFRTLAAVIFSRIWVPLGNSGQANVSAFKPMPIPSHLSEYFND